MYIDAARRFAESAERLDNCDQFDALDSPGKELRASQLVDAALAAVLTANSAVEAMVNDLFVERILFPAANSGPWFKGLSKDVTAAFADSWNGGTEWRNLVTKCHIAADIAGKPRMNFGSGYAQRMTLLIDLRNTLIHHKPISVEHGLEPLKSNDALERSLHQQFERSRICDNSYTFRWYGCLGAGCARWAHETTAGFIREFFKHFGVSYYMPI